VQVWRKGASRDLTRGGRRNPDEKLRQRAPAGGGKPAERAANRLGLVVSELTAEQKRELKSSGLLIEEVRGNTARAELRPGDVILAIISRGESTEFKQRRAVQQAAAGSFDKSANVTLLVRRGELQTFVTIKGLPDRRGE
jgi:serine protease Do